MKSEPKTQKLEGIFHDDDGDERRITGIPYNPDHHSVMFMTTPHGPELTTVCLEAKDMVAQYITAGTLDGMHGTPMLIGILRDGRHFVMDLFVPDDLEESRKTVPQWSFLVPLSIPAN